jgi:DNA mismatch repair protein MutS
VRPSFTDDATLDIRGGRHPIVERELPHGMFIPNDTRLGNDAHVVVLTGPNMAGKSTWLRQSALIVLMAQIGSFVPADSACIGLVDRIFTRIGAHDDLARGQSTFMVEMLETATILQQASERSLIVLDEVGRGTSTEDGVAIATAVVEHLAGQIRARTLFATHFRELAHECASIHGAQALQTAVTHGESGIVFLHTIVPGVADAALGLEIARLAGMPAAVLDRARAVVVPDRVQYLHVPPIAATAQELVRERIIEHLREIDIAGTTPLQALVQLAELQQHLRRSEFEELGPRALAAAEDARAFGRAD